MARSSRAARAANASAPMSEALPATLIVSITSDPTTPHAGGINMRTLGSTLLAVEGEGHTIVMAGTNSCVNEIAAD